MHRPEHEVVVRAYPVCQGSGNRAELELLNVGGGDVLRGVGVALGAMTQPPLQLVGISTCALRQVEGKGLPQIMGPQEGDVPRRIVQLRIVPAAE